MDLRTLNDLTAYLKRHRLKPKKQFSQNFFIDRALLKKIVAAAQIQPGDQVLEIGPGLGALTQTLLEAGAEVLAVEKDSTLADRIPQILSDYSDQLQVVCKDVLHQEFTTPMKVVSNIPYQITAPILTLLALKRGFFPRIVLVVQADVAEKLQKQVDDVESHTFTLFCQFYFHYQRLFLISKDAFYPTPQVDSAAICLIPRESLPLPEEECELFFSFVQDCFKHKRKQLKSAFKYLPMSQALEAIGKEQNVRAEKLSLDQFLNLFRLLKEGLEEDPHQKHQDTRYEKARS